MIITTTAVAEFAREVRRDLALVPKQLQSKYLYDALGSSLFEAICRLPWYRITRAEYRLLVAHVAEIVAQLGDDRSTIVELGCGTAYVGAWLKRRGARRVVGVDITPAQLATAQRLNRKTGLGLELVEANAEVVPLRDMSFDLVISEYGASIWCDPYKWIPEAARLLRIGGELVFLRNSTISMVCMPDTGKVAEALQRPQRGMNRLDWTDDDPGVEFHLGAGDLIRLLRTSGFEILDLVELYAPEGAKDHAEYSYVPAEWARRWPSEEIWRARKRG